MLGYTNYAGIHSDSSIFKTPYSGRLRRIRAFGLREYDSLGLLRLPVAFILRETNEFCNAQHEGFYFQENLWFTCHSEGVRSTIEESPDSL